MKKEEQILIKVSVGFYRGKKTSRELQEEISGRHMAAMDRISVRLDLLDKADRAALQNINNSARNILKNTTMPYDGTWRRTTTKVYSDVSSSLDKLKAKAMTTVQEIAGRWDKIIEDTGKKLPGLVTSGDMPATGKDFLEKFKFDVRIKGIEDDKIEVALPEDQVKKIKEQIRAEVQENIREGERWLAAWTKEMLGPIIKQVKAGYISGSNVQRTMQKVVDFLEKNGAEQSVIDSVKKLREQIGSTTSSKESANKAADVIMDELANFGK